jgi:hypothetical protein
LPLTVLITSADGAQYRLGPDEADAAWVPENIGWESVVPGGWKGGSFNLRRRIDEDIPLRLFDEVEIIDEHAQPVYEGRIQKLPRQHGDDYLLGVECMGWASHFLDDTSFREIYVDRDIGKWGAMPYDEKVALLTANADIQRLGGFQNDGGLVLPLPVGESLPAQVRADAWYLGLAGVQIANVEYRGTTTGYPAGWQLVFLFTDTESFSGGITVTPTLDDTVRTATPATATRNVFVHASSNGTAATPAAGARVLIDRLAVYGNHGLTKQSISGEPSGFYIDDMLADAISRAAPKLNYTTGDDGSIKRPPLPVPHAAYYDPGTVEPVVLDLNKYVLWDWLVYENRTFFYRPTDPDRLTWEARLDRGVHLSLEGDDGERSYNGAIVKYTLPDGKQKVAGPIGSGFDVESALLVDSDPENTVTRHGYPRRWIELDISFPTLDDYAVTIGAAYLAQASLPSRSGDITLRGEVEHPTKGLRAVREVRAGDWVRLSDHPADQPRRIISARHNDDGRETVVSVGNDMNKVDAILEQVGIAAKVANLG